jgi:predicted alpha/beta-fold hydrolase
MTSRSRLYRPAWWLPDAHSATLWGRLGRREPSLPVHTERWETPDGDFLEVVRMPGAHGPASPRVLLLHGLEGGIDSHYARALFREAKTRGWAADLLLFRTCGSEPNRLPRSYHSGETSDPRWVMGEITTAFPNAPLGLVGVSLGGNVLCKLLGEAGNALPPQVTGAVAMSVPFDLAAASRYIGRGFGAVYEKRFLRSLIPKALAKIGRHPELEPLRRVQQARTLWDFDDAFTAPLHGFSGAADYYARASSLPYLSRIQLPTLLLSAVDDPFLPPAVLEQVRREVAGTAAVEIEFPARGGHVGFTSYSGPFTPWYYGEWRAAEFLRQAMERGRTAL